VTQKTKAENLSPLSEISASRIVGHIEKLQGEKHPDHSPEALKNAADYITAELESAGLQARRAAISVHDASDAPCFNIIGALPDADDKKPILVIGAHYDTVAGSPGADDNASSLAVLLEAARVSTCFFETKTSPLHLEFAAFTLEESGFWGSRGYVKNAAKSGRKIWGLINLECIGYTDDNPGSQHSPPGLPISLPDQGNFIGILGNESAGPILESLESAIKRHTPDLPKVSLLLPKTAEALPDVRRSDHVPFWDKNIPAVMLTDTANFRNPHYHQSSDRIETLDVVFMTKIARALSGALIALTEQRDARC